MALSKREKFEISVLKSMIKDERYLNNCGPLSNMLEKIYDDYNNSVTELSEIKNEILGVITKGLPPEVHSIRGRVKDSYHVLEKIVRNYSEKPDKYGKVGLDNYNKIITDLIGIRIILLDKRDWKSVHSSILKVFKNSPDHYIQSPCDFDDYISNYDNYIYDISKTNNHLENAYLAEPPKVYITTEDDLELYKDSNLKMERSKTGYRSIHYIVRYKNVYFEMQVRTLFEEGWLEFDHKIKYPYDVNNTRKKQYIEVLNSLAQAADKLISFYDEKDFIEKRSLSGKKPKIGNKEIVSNKEKTNTLKEKIINLF